MKNTKTARPVNYNSLKSLLWIMLFDHTSLNITFPILTLLFFDNRSSFFSITTDAATRGHWYGLCIAIPHAVNLFCGPLLSVLSDIFGRRKILILATLGAALFAITAAISILWGSLSLLFIACIIRGIFSRTNPIAQAVIGDLFYLSAERRKEKVLYMGYLQTAISLGAFAGPILGGHLASNFIFAKWNFSLPFWTAAIFAGIAFLLAVYSFSETLPKKHTSPNKAYFHIHSLKLFLKNPQIWRITLILLFSQISWSFYYQYLPPTLKAYLHADANQIGYFVGFIALWLTLSTLFGIKILNSFFSSLQILKLSLWFLFIGTLINILILLFLPKNICHLLLWFIAIPIASGDVIAFSCICSIFSDLVKSTNQGKIMGLCFVIIAAVWMITAILGGQLLAINLLLPLALAPLGAMLAIFFAQKN